MDIPIFLLLDSHQCGTNSLRYLPYRYGGNFLHGGNVNRVRFVVASGADIHVLPVGCEGYPFGMLAHEDTADFPEIGQGIHVGMTVDLARGPQGFSVW